MPEIGSLIIVPPESTRASASKADPEIVAAMAAAISETSWGFDGKTYKTAKLATQAQSVYRRVLPKALDIEPHHLKSKIWGTDSKGSVVTDRTKNAEWRFAFTIDKTREKQTRKKKTETAVAPAVAPAVAAA